MDFAALQHSVFLQALGSAILNSLWQGFILWLIYETISFSYKTASAKVKNNLSTILLFFSFAWFIAGFISKIFNKENIAFTTTIPAGIAEQSNIHSLSGLHEFLSYTASTLPYLSVAYISLLFFLMARLFTAYRYVYFISNKRILNPPDELKAFASGVAQQIGITKKISVWISHHIDVPATIGFIKPVVLIPFASINNLSGQQLEAIILHELSHIKRNDYIINLIISVIETILFFNPFVVLLSNAIKRERENCCDDFVLQYQYDPHSYATALLRLEQSRMSNLKLAIGAVSGKKQLLSRIKRITNGQVVSSQFNYGQKLLSLFLVTAVICSVAWLSPHEKKSDSTKVLEKEIKSVSLLNSKSLDKTINITDNQNEKLQLIIKHIFPKNKPATFSETNIENFSPKNFSFKKNKSKDNIDFLTVDSNSEFSETSILKHPDFSFDGSKIKLPLSVNIKNFPFQNINFNIDLSKIDMGKLNENLQQAYKEISALDWNKIQNEINKSFSKVKAGNLLQKDRAGFYIEKAKVLSKIVEAQRQNNSKELIEKVQKEILAQDSLRGTEMALMYKNNTNNTKMQQVYKRVQKIYGEPSRENYYFNYRNKTAPKNKEAKTEFVEENNSHLVSGTKNIRISIIKHVGGTNGLSKEKQILQFSFNNGTKKSGDKKIINVEISEMP
jgi:beta-lactamase regulating signal transducer with metallopeptidase domain